ncbi:MAG TPA: glycerophosphodiester phosphodiesterase [Stellaceae bacterium]
MILTLNGAERNGLVHPATKPSPMRAAAGAAEARVEDWIPPVIGHRGAAARAPENTLGGLRRARALGCRWVELDARLTGDGELVLLHDERLERTTNGRGKVGAQPLAAIRHCDAGAWFDPSFAGEGVPTLAETIEVLAELGLGANIEIKAARGRAAATGAATAELLARRWPRELPAPLISSFLGEALTAARDCMPAIARGWLVGAVPRDWREQAGRLGCAAIHADHRRLRPAIVAEIRHAGYAVLAYTVNNSARARELFAWGVASVFSDVPDIILAGAPAGAPRPASPGPALDAAQRQGAGW